MEIYKIIFAEFTKYKEDNEYKSFMNGTTDRTYRTEVECTEAFEKEYNYIIKEIPFYETVEELFVGKYEFKLKGITKDGRKEVVHHFKIVKFDI